MGIINAAVVGIIGMILVFVFSKIPIDTLLKFVPICWIPSFNCKGWYDKIIMYFIVIILAIIIFFIPSFGI